MLLAEVELKDFFLGRIFLFLFLMGLQQLGPFRVFFLAIQLVLIIFEPAFVLAWRHGN